MTNYNEGELKMVIQGLMGVFIAYAVTRFFYEIGVNYSMLAGVVAFIGLAVLYFCFRKNKEFDTFIISLCLIGIPFSIMYGFLIMSAS